MPDSYMHCPDCSPGAGLIRAVDRGRGLECWRCGWLAKETPAGEAAPLSDEQLIERILIAASTLAGRRREAGDNDAFYSWNRVWRLVDDLRAQEQ